MMSAATSTTKDESFYMKHTPYYILHLVYFAKIYFILPLGLSLEKYYSVKMPLC